MLGHQGLNNPTLIIKYNIHAQLGISRPLLATSSSPTNKRYREYSPMNVFLFHVSLSHPPSIVHNVRCDMHVYSETPRVHTAHELSTAPHRRPDLTFSEKSYSRMKGP